MENQRQAKRDMRVRQLTLADQPELLTLLKDRQLAASAGLQLTPDRYAQQWALQNWLRQAELYGIFKTKKLIGLVVIFLGDNDGEIGYLIQPAFRKQHIMTTAVKIVLQQTECHSLKAEVRVDNLASQHILITNGFKSQSSSSQFIQYSWQCK